MSRRATIRTTHDDPETVADAIAPDNTDEMETTVADGTVVTHIERETTGGLHSTVDDYVVNLEVATTVAEAVDGTDAGSDADSEPTAGTDAQQAADIGLDDRTDTDNTTETYEDNQ